ncbi:MAG: radical SAM protein [bacterium]
MRVLALNPPDELKVVLHPAEDGSKFLEPDDYGHYPPLGLLYLLGQLEATTRGHETFFADCVAERIGHADLVRRVLEPTRPDLVAVTSFTISLLDVIETCRAIKAWNPRCFVVLGGHHPIAYPREAARLECVDAIVVGEGELAFTALVEARARGESIESIEGVYTRESIDRHEPPATRDKRFLAHVSVKPAYVEDLDALAFPARRHIRHIDYHSVLGVTRKMVTMITSRGCPYLCTFCDVPIKSYRERHPDRVAEEARESQRMGYEEIHFYDDLFNIDERRVHEICDALDRAQVHMTWSFRGRVMQASREMLARAQRSGLRQVSVGVETSTDDGLAALKKATSIEQVESFFAWCRELGIATIADYMIGLPFERTATDLERSFAFVKKLDPDYVQFSICTLYPHTEMYEQAVRQGIVKPGRWDEFAQRPARGFVPDHWTESFTVKELARWQRRMYKRYYFRPRYVWRSLFRTRSLYELAQKAFGALRILLAT